MNYVLFEKIYFSRLIKESLNLIFIKNNLKKLSKSNELKDYRNLLRKKDLRLNNLYYMINVIRLQQQKSYKSYDYGQGYFYQSIPDVEISGYRDTQLRIDKLGLKTITKNKSVLDIGSNAGAILFNLRNLIKSGLGVENNPYLIKISNLIQQHLNINNISFIESDFEDLNVFDKFDVVLSLANHKTFDGNTKQNLIQYFDKIRKHLKKDGKLVFESHPPEIENEDQFSEVLNSIKLFFNIESAPKIDMPGFLDKNRKYLICSCKK